METVNEHNTKYDTSLDFARQKDKQDELHGIRDHFFIQPDEIYMDGNSLGMASKEAEEALLHTLEVWKKEGIKIWNTQEGKYYHYAKTLSEPMAKLINAAANEVIVVGSTTSNIHQAISTFYHPTADRYKILVDDLNFPTDRYAVDSQVINKGYDPKDAVKVVVSEDGRFIDEQAVIDAMTDDVAVILLPTVLYRSAQIIDMKRLTVEAHKRGIIIGFDLCHAIGAIEMDFNDIQPDFAVWCNYKYLSGGPGAIAGLYINKQHFHQVPGMAGWFGNRDETQFQLKHEFEHQPDASGWQVGSPPLFAMAPLEGVLKIFDQVGMNKIRSKSLDLTAYLMYLIDTKLAVHGCGIGNSREDHKRGGHVCFEHDEAYRISQALRDNGVIPDFREPNVIRLAPVALYNSFEDVYKVVDIIERIITEQLYEKYSDKRALVV